MYIALLEQFLEDIARVARLEGNQGRRVSRVIEQYFVDGVSRLTLELPMEMSRLEFAANLDAAGMAAREANFEMVQQQAPGVFSVESFSVPQRSIVVRLVAQPPQSMRDRQQFLLGIARGVETMTSMWATHSRIEAEVLDALTEDHEEEERPQARAAYLAGFNDLLDGNHALVNTLPMPLVRSARLLSPEVDSAWERACQSLAVATLEAAQAIALV